MRTAVSFLIVLSLGCHARSALDVNGSTVKIMRLASFEPSANEPTPKPIEQWLGEGASGLPADLVPPGLLTGGTPLPHFKDDEPRFHDHHEIEARLVEDPLARELRLWAKGAGFAEEHASCMYPEFGMRVSTSGGPGADVLVSLACAKVLIREDDGTTSEENLSADARARFVGLAKRAFGSAK